MELIHIETIVLEIKPNKDTKLLVVIMYRPPSTPNESFKQDMRQLLDKAIPEYDHIWLIGDLNYDMLSRNKCSTLTDIADSYNLTQLITEPTNITRQGQSLIDVALTTSPNKSNSTGSMYTGLSDSHNLIYVTLKFRAPRLPRKVVTYRNYKTFNADRFSEYISYITKNIAQVFDDPSDNYWAYQTLLREITDEHAPLKTIKVKAREAPFMNKTLKQAIRKRRRCFKIFQRFPNTTNWEK